MSWEANEDVSLQEREKKTKSKSFKKTASRVFQWVRNHPLDIALLIIFVFFLFSR